MRSSHKKPDLGKPAFQLYKGSASLVSSSVCPTCGNPISEFRNEISRKEFSISGMCQDCQDSVFGKD